MRRRRVLTVALGATLALGVLSGGSAGAIARHATTAPSQELPQLGAITTIGFTSIEGQQAGYPTFRWKFPARDGSGPNWVTIDDSPLEIGAILSTAGSTVVAEPLSWTYEPDGRTLDDGTSSGPGWSLYFTSNTCGGANNFVMSGFAGPSNYLCPKESWQAITDELSGVPGTWISLAQTDDCGFAVALNGGGSCLARFIPLDEMSRYITAITDVEVWDTQPWDVLCPVNVFGIACWGTAPPPVDNSVNVSVLPQQSPIPGGTTSDSLAIEVSNVHDHDVVVSSIAAELPGGFRYTPGSTAGAVTGDPTVTGQTLTWTGPFMLPAHSNLLFGFGASIDPALTGGDYVTTASAVTDQTYSGTGTVTISPTLTPLIFVPGIMGSKLSCGINLDEFWPRFGIDFTGLLFERLALTNHGNDESFCPAALKANDIVDTAFNSEEYGATIDALEANGYVLNRTLFKYPFDWRKSVQSAAFGLEELIDSVRAQTHVSQVDILAHSQGGLVTRVALTDPATIGKVRRVLTMATPYYGAAKLLAVLLSGNPCVPKDVPIDLVFWHFPYCPLSGASVQKVLRTMPGPHDLLPSPSYFSAVHAPLSLDGTDFTPTQYQSFVAVESDPVLVDSAFQYHATYDTRAPADPNVQWTQVVGHGKRTLGYVALSSDPRLDWATFRYVDGDGTVPSGSAESGGLFPTVGTNGVNHMGIATSSCTLEFAVEYFQETTSPSTGGCVGPDTPPNTAGPSALRKGAAASTAVELAVDGSLDGVVSDSAGRTTNGDTDDTAIPDSDYNALGDSQSFLFEAPGSYYATFTTTGPGMARLRVRSLGLDGPLAQALFLIPALPQGARLSLDLDAQDVGATRVAADLDGNGTTDEVLSPDAVTTGAAAADTTPPTIAGDATLAGLFASRVTLTADDPGSGVAHIYYRVGSGAEETYTGPFTAPMFSTISFRAMDAAGNMSAESAFVADDAPNTREFADPLLPFRPVLRFLDPRGDVDWFTFHANGTSRYRVQLYQLPADYDLQLFDSNGGLVAAPRVRGLGAEEIFQLLPAGTYYVEVTAAANTHGANRPWDRVHPYGLQLLTVAGR